MINPRSPSKARTRAVARGVTGGGPSSPTTAPGCPRARLLSFAQCSAVDPAQNRRSATLHEGGLSRSLKESNGAVQYMGQVRRPDSKGYSSLGLYRVLPR